MEETETERDARRQTIRSQRAELSEGFTIQTGDPCVQLFSEAMSKLGEHSLHSSARDHRLIELSRIPKDAQLADERRVRKRSQKRC